MQHLGRALSQAAGRASDGLAVPPPQRDWNQTRGAWLRRASIVFGAVSDLLACIEALLDDPDIAVVRVRRYSLLSHMQAQGTKAVEGRGRQCQRMDVEYSPVTASQAAALLFHDQTRR